MQLWGGYRLFDTASEYKNEDILGKALSECFRLGIIKREDLFIQTKYYPITPYGEEDVYEQFSKSLEKLRLDYVDAYFIHKPVPWHSELSYRECNKKVWEAFKRLKEEGKIRYLGVSNFAERHIDFLEDKDNLPFINQLEIHPTFQQKGLCDWCREKGMVIQAWSPLARGDMFNEEMIAELTRKYDRTAAQVCLRWSIQMGYIPITSAEVPSWIKENAGSMDFELDEEDMQRLFEINSDDRHWDLWLYRRRSMY